MNSRMNLAMNRLMVRVVLIAAASLSPGLMIGCSGYDVGGGWLMDAQGEKWDDRQRHEARVDPTTAQVPRRPVASQRMA